MRVRLTALLAALAVAMASGLVLDPSVAGPTLPRHAVARLLTHTSVDYAGYESVRAPCRTCLTKPSYTASNWASPSPYQLGEDSQGLLVVASLVKPDVVRVTRIDPTTGTTVSSGRIAFTLARFTLVTAYLAPSGDLYALLARNGANKSQSASFVVGRVEKFGPDLTLAGIARITSEAADSHGVFRFAPLGAPSMLVRDGTLVLHTSRTIYADSNGIHHEANFTIGIDTTSMSVLPSSAGYPWVSHSFNELVDVAQGSLLLVDHGDAYPRAVSLSVEPDYFPSATVGTSRDSEALTIKGSLGDNFTGVTTNSLQTGAGRALIAGISVPDTHAIDGVTGVSSGYSPNVYVTSTDISSGDTRFHWITDFNPIASPRRWVGQPAIVQLRPRQFAILFSIVRPKSRVMKYVLVDARGRQLAHRLWKSSDFAALSAPELIGHRIFWVGFHAKRTATTGSHLLYALDVSDPFHPAFVR
jgi:hypothetical protein